MIGSSNVFRINGLGVVPTPRNIASFRSAIALRAATVNCVRETSVEASEKHTVNRQWQQAKIGRTGYCEFQVKGGIHTQ